MKTLSLIFCSFLIFTSPAFSQKHIRFILDHFSSVSSLVNRDGAQKALNLEAEVLSSPEFRSALLAYKFDCRNSPAVPCDCNHKNTQCDTNHRISGETVYAAIMKDSVVHINLDIARIPIWTRVFASTYGKSCPCINHTLTYPWWLDNGELPVIGNYAYHLAHEFTHISGFVHGDQPISDDTAYVVGEIVKKILKARQAS